MGVVVQAPLTASVGSHLSPWPCSVSVFMILWYALLGLLIYFFVVYFLFFLFFSLFAHWVSCLFVKAFVYALRCMWDVLGVGGLHVRGKSAGDNVICGLHHAWSKGTTCLEEAAIRRSRRRSNATLPLKATTPASEFFRPVYEATKPLQIKPLQKWRH